MLLGFSCSQNTLGFESSTLMRNLSPLLHWTGSLLGKYQRPQVSCMLEHVVLSSLYTAEHLCVSLVVLKISDMFPVWLPLMSICFTVYLLQSNACADDSRARATRRPSKVPMEFMMIWPASGDLAG